MPIDVRPDTIALREAVSVEEAETLLEALQARPDHALNLSDCTHVHAAALQVLMAADRPVLAWPQDPELSRWLRAALPTATA